MRAYFYLNVVLLASRSCVTVAIKQNKDFQKVIKHNFSECEDGIGSCSIGLMFGHLNESYSEVLRDVILLNDDLPNECRTDICLSKTTISSRKGNLYWHETTIGERYIQKCFYPSEKIQYAFQDCLYSTKNITFWSNYNDDNCPGPPLSEEIEKIRNKHKHHYHGCFDALEIFQKLFLIDAKYPEHPILDEDRKFIIKYFIEKFKICWPQGGNLNLVLENVILKFLDMLLSPKFYWNMDLFEGVFIFLKDSFSNDELNEELTQEDLEEENDFFGKNLLLFHRISSNGYLNRTFNLGANNSVVIAFDWDCQELKRADISMIFFRTFDKLHLTNIISEEDFLHNKTSELLDWPGHSLRFIELAGSLVYLEFKTAEGYNSSHDTPRQHRDNARKLNASIILIFKSPYFKEVISEGRKVYCARHPYQASKTDYVNGSLLDGQKWTDDCKTMVFGTSVKCECSEFGFVAVMTAHDLIRIHMMANGKSNAKQDLSVFLGFPYHHEVYLLGMILRAASIVALAVTMFNFLVFSKTRKGVATHILLNLCFSLICLLIVLYIAEQRSNIKRECRIYNILRYYFILVSLMWNGMEAHNMYRMLIKVFNSRVRYFVRIAALISWGLPFLLVCITLIFDIKAFDGIYVGCIFRCSLRSMTMYLAWLVPMSIIILHNLAIFGLVLKVLCQDKSSELRNDSMQEKGSIKSRLSGACGILVLLGVPWILSPFGAIQRENNEKLQYFQGVIGIIFIVFVSLQGLFIFLFHCVRNPQVRSQWSSNISAIRSSTSRKRTQSTLVSQLKGASS